MAVTKLQISSGGGTGGQEGAIAPGRRRRGGATAAPGEGALLGEGDFVAML